MSLSTVLAKALFDNVAESPEELGFRKGDILMVLEQEGGGPGWWVCSLHGRQGIAPANRLRLLNTSTPSPTPGTTDSTHRPTPSVTDPASSVYLSPRPPAEDSVYLSPPSVSGAGRGDGRPRVRSSSASRPRTEWDIGASARARSPSLRGRGSEATLKPQALYQTPVAPPDAVYLSPSGLPRPAAPDPDTYLVPRTSTAPGEEVYQIPSAGMAASSSTPRSSSAQPAFTNGGTQEPPGVYQTPKTPSTPKTPHSERRLPDPGAAQGSPRPQPKVLGASTTPTNGRAKLAQSSSRDPPCWLGLAAAGPRAPLTSAANPLPLHPPSEGTSSASKKEEGQKDGRMEEEKKKMKKKEEEGEYEEPEKENMNNQVYDTPPTSRWQHTLPPAVCVDDSIYNTPRGLPADVDTGSEVYDVPTLSATITSDLQQQPYSIPASLAAGVVVEEEDVYSVPSLPGDLSAGPGFEAVAGELYSVPGPGARAPVAPPDGPLPSEDLQEGPGLDCGVYDMPALALDGSSTSAPPRRSSVSSTGSGDVQWKGSLSALVQSAISLASHTPSPSRELATSLAEILSVWKAGQETDTPLPLAPPHLQSEPGWPQQAPSPFPGLPVPQAAAGAPCGGGEAPECGHGGAQGQLDPGEAPTTSTPPCFPLPPAPPTLIPTNLQGEEEEPGNEYAGIGLTAAPPLFNGGDSGGYVKLQGLPEPPTNIPTENAPPTAEPPAAEQRSSPSPPLPVSLSLEDSELLSFYSSQSLAHLSCLADSIDSLFTSVQGNQPPRVFVSRGKSLIVTAHKLVFIGDTLSRLLTSPDLRAKVNTSGARLCQALKAVVVATKGAAQNYPSVPATQEMVDRVADLSQHAAGFSGLLQRLADIS
ncbi:hypothetical protein AGOR_G00187180 [Albula goreensis]|uniref:SH3 domain-containing protein n=1 Tax=Albula goreensis TaxID=1534307 RepID=A0A8T3D1E1_9TELE|nr:hypothetical protein AGOR_G00187180 [Albula goreensis]